MTEFNMPEYKISEITRGMRLGISEANDKAAAASRYYDPCYHGVCFYDGRQRREEDCPYRFICRYEFYHEKDKYEGAARLIAEAMSWFEAAMRQMRWALAGILRAEFVAGALWHAIYFLKECLWMLLRIAKMFPGLLPSWLIAKIEDMIAELECKARELSTEKGKAKFRKERELPVPGKYAPERMIGIKYYPAKPEAGTEYLATPAEAPVARKAPSAASKLSAIAKASRKKAKRASESDEGRMCCC